jgi:arylsulfatase A-like enzyme
MQPGRPCPQAQPAAEGVAPSGTTHGSGYAYDTHVPVFFYGPGFKAGRVTAGARVTDIVPTLSAVLRMDVPPGCVGRVLSEVLAPAAEVPKPASKKAAR